MRGVSGRQTRVRTGQSCLEFGWLDGRLSDELRYVRTITDSGLDVAVRSLLDHVLDDCLFSSEGMKDALV